MRVRLIVVSSIIDYFISECLDASSKAPEYVRSADDDSVNYSVVQDAIMDKKNLGHLQTKSQKFSHLKLGHEGGLSSTLICPIFISDLGQRVIYGGWCQYRPLYDVNPQL